MIPSNNYTYWDINIYKKNLDNIKKCIKNMKFDITIKKTLNISLVI